MSGEILHCAPELEICGGGNRRFWPLCFAVFGIERIDVGHTTQHLEKDDIFRFAETGPAWHRSGGSSDGFLGRESGLCGTV